MNTMVNVSDINLEVCKIVSQHSVLWLLNQCLQCLIYSFHLDGLMVLSTTFMVIVIDSVSINRTSELVSRTSRSIVEFDNSADDLKTNDVVSSGQTFEFFVVEMCVRVDIDFPVLVLFLIVFAWVLHRYREFVLVSSFALSAIITSEDIACKGVTHDILCCSFDVKVGNVVAWVYQDEADLAT